MDDLEYTASKTGASFLKSAAFGRIIAGPIGSGKTTACIYDTMMHALGQAPGENDIRYTRFGIIRRTLKQLKDTVLKDCETILSANGLGHWRVSDSMYYLNFDDVKSEWYFLPLETSEDQDRILSMQLTGAWMSECIEMDISVISPLTGRLGRYPYGKRGNCTWNGIIADTNMPTELTPWHVFMERIANGDVADWQLFRQPSGLSIDAENLPWLLQTDETKRLSLDHPDRIARGREYYDRLVRLWGENHPWVKRYVKAEYGPDPSGEAVFQESFISKFHTVEDTIIIPGYPIIVGQDFGRNPWSLICQVDHMGRLLVHEEVPAANIGLEKHVNERLKPALYRRFMTFKVALIGDPSGIAKNSISEEDSFQCLKRLGLPAYPAPTNDIDPRIRAVEALLARQTAGGPSLIISRKGCPKLCQAMAGGYRYKKTKDGGLQPKPEKNHPEGYDHVADCLECVALIVHGGMMPYVAQYLWPAPKPRRPKFSAAAWT